MTSRRFIALLLCAGLFGSGQALALEPAGDEAAEVSLAHAAVSAASALAEPIVVRAAELQRPVFVLTAPPSLSSAPLRALAARVAPSVHAARPDVVTRPSQGPPRGR
jgi:hypothetical protein